MWFAQSLFQQIYPLYHLECRQSLFPVKFGLVYRGTNWYREMGSDVINTILGSVVQKLEARFACEDAPVENDVAGSSHSQRPKSISMPSFQVSTYTASLY